MDGRRFGTLKCTLSFVWRGGMGGGDCVMWEAVEEDEDDIDLGCGGAGAGGGGGGG